MSDQKHVLSVQVTEETLRRLDALARREGRTRSWAARELIDRSIRRLRLPPDEEEVRAS